MRELRWWNAQRDIARKATKEHKRCFTIKSSGLVRPAGCSNDVKDSARGTETRQVEGPILIYEYMEEMVSSQARATPLT